jgi:TolA-binding protein
MKFSILCLSLILIISGCSSKSDKEYMAEAEKNIQGKNISEAISSYEKVLENYPESENAPEALYQIAVLYQNKLVKNLSEYESLNKAAGLYKDVYNKYPESKRAPSSLFMSAFIQANDLKKFEEATSGYKLFLQKYPNHELSSSAREELNHMGLSPEEILIKKNNTNI